MQNRRVQKFFQPKFLFFKIDDIESVKRSIAFLPYKSGTQERLIEIRRRLHKNNFIFFYKRFRFYHAVLKKSVNIVDWFLSDCCCKYFHFLINIFMKNVSVIFLLLLNCMYACTQSSQRMDFEKYEPKSTLVVPQHIVTHAKFPFIDVHNHQWDVPNQNIPALFTEMDSLNMKVMVNLSGKSYKETIGRRNGGFDVQGNDYLVRSIQHVAETNGKRLKLFTNISFVGFGEKGWTEKAVKELEKDVQSGACGLKIYKDLGLDFKDENNHFIHIDDPRLDAIWEKCGELHIPVLIHAADPKNFWDPVDDKNERWLEVTTHPDRSYYNKGLPSWEELIKEQHNIFAKHPNTTFIAAHFGWLANNLRTLDSLLTALPNVCVEFGAIIAEIGRQPVTAKKFFENRIGRDSKAFGYKNNSY